MQEISGMNAAFFTASDLAQFMENDGDEGNTEGGGTEVVGVGVIREGGGIVDVMKEKSKRKSKKAIQMILGGGDRDGKDIRPPVLSLLQTQEGLESATIDGDNDDDGDDDESVGGRRKRFNSTKISRRGKKSPSTLIDCNRRLSPSLSASASLSPSPYGSPINRDTTGRYSALSEERIMSSLPRRRLGLSSSHGRRTTVVGRSRGITESKEAVSPNKNHRYTEESSAL